MYPNKFRKLNSMGMGMDVNFQYSMDMSTGMDVIFENRYECGYNSTCPIAIPTHKLPQKPISHPLISSPCDIK